MSAWNLNVKALLLKGLERVGQTASSLASNAHQKLDVLNLETRRGELLHEIPVQALELWQSGVELPEKLSTLLAELNELDQQLTVIRAQRYPRWRRNSQKSSPQRKNLKKRKSRKGFLRDRKTWKKQLIRFRRKRSKAETPDFLDRHWRSFFFWKILRCVDCFSAVPLLHWLMKGGFPNESNQSWKPDPFSSAAAGNDPAYAG